MSSQIAQNKAALIHLINDDEHIVTLDTACFSFREAAAVCDDINANPLRPFVVRVERQGFVFRIIGNRPASIADHRKLIDIACEALQVQGFLFTIEKIQTGDVDHGQEVSFDKIEEEEEQEDFVDEDTTRHDFRRRRFLRSQRCDCGRCDICI